MKVFTKTFTIVLHYCRQLDKRKTLVVCVLNEACLDYKLYCAQSIARVNRALNSEEIRKFCMEDLNRISKPCNDILYGTQYCMQYEQWMKFIHFNVKNGFEKSFSRRKRIQFLSLLLNYNVHTVSIIESDNDTIIVL